MTITTRTVAGDNIPLSMRVGMLLVAVVVGMHPFPAPAQVLLTPGRPACFQSRAVSGRLAGSGADRFLRIRSKHRMRPSGRTSTAILPGRILQPPSPRTICRGTRAFWRYCRFLNNEEHGSKKNELILIFSTAKSILTSGEPRLI